MKKIIMMVAVVMSITTANAENANPFNMDVDYSVKFNNSDLAKELNLSQLQSEAMSDINDELSFNVSCVKYARKSQKSAMLTRSLYDNLKSVRTVLNADQYRQYLRLLNVKMGNQGLLQYFSDNIQTSAK